MILDIVKIGATLIDKLIPDEKKRAEAKLKLVEMEQKGQLNEIKAGQETVQIEAQGESWLQRNWRPLTMLTFVGLVVAKWLGFTSDGVTEAVEMELMHLIQIGLGGYVLGRSAEKGIKEWKK